MRLLDSKKNKFFFSLLAVFIITVIPKVGVYINTNNYNTIRYDLGFPATWISVTQQFSFADINLTGLVINIAFFYLFFVFVDIGIKKESRLNV
ncbi:hypothetical protein CHH74_17300 [Shouchella clausii]|nr:hypothetical protein CHH74_17300 [Shouchella clausii]